MKGPLKAEYPPVKHPGLDVVVPSFAVLTTAEIDQLNRQLVERDRPYLLIGFGRLACGGIWN